MAPPERPAPHGLHRAATVAAACLAPLTLLLALCIAFTGRATAAPTGAPAQILSSGLRTPPPAIYQFFDWGTDYGTTHPEYGAIGSEHMLLWQQINPAPGVFDWSAADADLAREAQLRVTLRDGTVIPKPVVIRVSFFLASAKVWSCPNIYFWDGTPGWVYDEIDRQNPGNPRPIFCDKKVGHAITCPTNSSITAIVPMWDNATWRQRYFEMVRALGQHYANNPQVAAVVIETGLDGETQMTKPSGCNWDSVIGSQVPGIRSQFEQTFIPESMKVFREAFPNTPVFISNTPGGSGIRAFTSQLAATFNPPIGIKNCGAWVDQENHQGYGDNVGLFDMFRTYSQTLPIWIETKSGLSDYESRYWTWLAMLHYHPDGIDVHQAWITESDPAWLRFAQDHIGRTLADTPDVWCALRDTEFPLQTWGAGGSSGQSGHIGDWTFWLTRLENAPGNKTVRLMKAELPAACQDQVYSRQARRTDQTTGNPYMSFDIADGYPYVGQKPLSEPGGSVAYQVELIILNHGTDTFSLQYRDWAGNLVSKTIQKGPALGPADRWVTLNLDLQDAYLNNNLPGGADLRLSCNNDGDETVHFVLVRGYRVSEAQGATTPATPTPTPAQPPTSAPTPTLPMIISDSTGAPTPSATTVLLPTLPPVMKDSESAGGELVLSQGLIGQTVFDTYIDQWAPTANYATKRTLTTRTGDIKEALLLFATPRLPAGASLDHATLRLYAVARSNPQAIQIEATQILRPWDQWQATWKLAQTGIPWGQPGARDPATDRAATGLSSAWVSALGTWVDLDVTPAVRVWLESPSDNAGLLIHAISSGSVEYQFASSQWWTLSCRPQLRIRYRYASTDTATPAATATPVPPTPTSTPSSTPLPPTPTAALTRRTFQQGLEAYAGQQDTTLDQWLPTAVYGAKNTIYLRTGDVKAGLLRFDLSAVPQTARLHSAKLHLYVDWRTNPSAVQFAGYALNRPWSAPEATWQQAAAGTPWAVPGANGVPGDRDGLPVFTLPLGSASTWMEADVTTLAQKWVASPATNYGLVLKVSGNSAVEYALRSAEWGDVRYRPQLELAWEQ